MSFNLVWSLNDSGFYTSSLSGLTFNLDLVLQKDVATGISIPSLLTRTLRVKDQDRAPLLYATPLHNLPKLVRVKHSGFVRKHFESDESQSKQILSTQVHAEAVVDENGQKYRLLPGGFLQDLYIADPESALKAGAPVPPLVPGYVWVDSSWLENVHQKHLIVSALDHPEDLHFRVLGRNPLVQYASVLADWAAQQRRQRG